MSVFSCQGHGSQSWKESEVIRVGGSSRETMVDMNFEVPMMALFGRLEGFSNFTLWSGSGLSLFTSRFASEPEK